MTQSATQIGKVQEHRTVSTDNPMESFTLQIATDLDPPRPPTQTQQVFHSQVTNMFSSSSDRRTPGIQPL